MKFLFVILLYLYLFPLRLKGIPLFEYIPYFFLGIDLIINFKAYNEIFEIEFVRSYFLNVLIVLGLSISSIVIFNPIGMDLFGPLHVFKLILMGLISIMFLLRLKLKCDDGYFYILRYYSDFCFLVSITILLEFAIPDIKYFLSSIINTTGNINYEDSFRLHGISSSGGSSLSAALFLGLLSTKILKVSTKNNLYYYVKLILIFSATFLTGRTGLFAIIFYLSLKSFQKLSQRPFFFGALLLTASLALWNYLINFSGDFSIEARYALEPIINLIEKNEFSSKSTQNIFNNMIYLPELKHLLLGAGFYRFPVGSYYLSDIGYFKFLFSFGIIGTSLLMYVFVVFFARTKKALSRIFSSDKLEIYLLIYMIFIFHLKEDFLTKNYSIKFLLLLGFYSMFVGFNRFKNLNYE